MGSTAVDVGLVRVSGLLDAQVHLEHGTAAADVLRFRRLLDVLFALLVREPPFVASLAHADTGLPVAVRVLGICADLAHILAHGGIIGIVDRVVGQRLASGGPGPAYERFRSLALAALAFILGVLQAGIAQFLFVAVHVAPVLGALVDLRVAVELAVLGAAEAFVVVLAVLAEVACLKVLACLAGLGILGFLLLFGGLLLGSLLDRRFVLRALCARAGEHLDEIDFCDRGAAPHLAAGAAAAGVTGVLVAIVAPAAPLLLLLVTSAGAAAEGIARLALVLAAVVLLVTGAAVLE